MSRIRELTQESAAHLRHLVRQRFLLKHPNGSGFRASSFKGAYEDLRDDMVKNVPGAEFSVSLIRLRKLFYYTDPDVCPSDQLKKPSFGRDFVEALELYTGTEQLVQSGIVRPLAKKVKRWRMRLLLLFLLAAGSFAAWFFQSLPPKSWKEDFDDTSAEYLRSRGFAWLDFDSEWWSRQKKEGALTLYALPGDYWIKPNEKRVIKNMLYKKVRGRMTTAHRGMRNRFRL